MAEHLAWLFSAMGEEEILLNAVQSHDPQETMLNWVDNAEIKEWSGGRWGVFEKKHVISLVIATHKTLLSIMLYGRSLSALVQEVRDGSDSSLFAAVRVDRSIVANAMKGLSGKHWARYHDLRYSLTVLRDMGLDKLSDAQLEDLLVHKLKVYPNTYNARKNLRAQYTASKKHSTI